MGTAFCEFLTYKTLNEDHAPLTSCRQSVSRRCAGPNSCFTNNGSNGAASVLELLHILLLRGQGMQTCLSSKLSTFATRFNIDDLN